MRSGTKVLIAAAILTRAFSIVPLESRADETAEPDAPQAFPSPSEVFDAYRQAQDKRDGQAAFSCLTSEFRDDEIYDAYLTCITYTTHLDPDSPKVAALLKKFGIESSLVDAEYGKRYKEKYDVDIAKLIAQRKKNLAKVAEDYFKQHGIEPSDAAQKVPVFVDASVATATEEFFKQRHPKPAIDGQEYAVIPCSGVGPAIPPTDETLRREIVLSCLTNGVAFYEGFLNLFKDGERSPAGKLEGLTIQGDVAIGRATTPFISIGSRAGQAMSKAIQEKVFALFTTFHFRKSNGGWLISGRDYPTFSPPNAAKSGIQ